MKKIVFALSALTLSATIALTSCNNVELENISSNGTITIEFQQVDPETPAIADEATRTEYHDNTIWWTSGDQVTFGQYASVGGAMTYKGTYLNVSSTREKVSASISTFNAPDDATDSYYFSVYPKASFTSYSTSTGHVLAKITTPSVQTPTTTNFDRNADLLISNYAENLTPNGEGKYTVQMSYYRQVALGKMRIINLPSANEIDSVEFSAVCDETNVTLAGIKWYDFTTQGPYSVNSHSYKLTLDYSALNISGDMTAHFCCYPFSLAAGDNFTVKVYTKAGEVFTRKVNLTGAQTLTLEAARGTQFTVDMSTATRTDRWITTKEYSSGSNVKTTNKIVFSVKSTQTTIVSGKFKAVTEDVFAGISDISAYLDENGSDVAASTISGLNEGKTYIFNGTGLTGDTWCVGMVKLVLDDSTVGISIVHIKTDWFTMTAQTRAEGGISYFYYGKDLVSATRNVRIMATEDLPDGQTFETYYTSTLAPGGIPSATLEAINGKNGASSTGFYTTKYYTGKSTQANMVPGTNYTVMIKAVNARGETKFVSVNANAGGTTE